MERNYLKMKHTRTFIHLMCGTLVLATLTGISIYTVFVNQTGGPLAKKSFLNLKTYLGLYKKTPPELQYPLYTITDTTVRELPTGESFNLPKDAKNLQLLIHDNSTKISYSVDGTYFVYDTQSKKTNKLPLAEGNVLGFISDTEIISSFKKAENEWQIVRWQLTNTNWQKKPFAFSYSQPLYNQLERILSYLDCSDTCQIKIIHLDKADEVITLPVFTDPSYFPTAHEARLLFVDSQRGVAGYMLPNDELYVISFDIELLQLVRLQNERNIVHYGGYFPSTGQLLFKLEEKSGAYTQIALFAADTASLQLLQKIPVTASVTVYPQYNAFAVDNSLFNLSGREVTTLDIKSLISYE